MLHNLRKTLLIKGIEIISCRNIFEMLNKFMKELMVFLLSWFLSLLKTLDIKKRIYFSTINRIKSLKIMLDI